MIDWSTAPEWAIGAAMDGDGKWFWYSEKPEHDRYGGDFWDGDCLYKTVYQDWRESWTPRPMTTEPTTTKVYRLLKAIEPLEYYASIQKPATIGTPDWNGMSEEVKVAREQFKQSEYMTTEPINDGGPAYPSGKSEKTGFENSHPLYEGMTLRDYFAGQALMGLVVHNDYGSISDINIAKGAYSFADAMLEARNQSK